MFVTILVLSLAALALGHTEIDDVLVLTPLLVGACVAVCTANNSSQDYKTLELCGMRVQEGFIAQFIGLMLGAIVVPLALYVAHDAYILGSENLPAPQASMFAGVFEAILIDQSLPIKPISIGAAIGIGAILLEILGKKRGLILPAMALAVGIYLPADMGIAILVGSLIRFMAEGNGARQRGESILTAAGLITGAALLELILGVAIIFGFSDSMQQWATLLAFVVIGYVIFKNSRGAAKRNPN